MGHALAEDRAVRRNTGQALMPRRYIASASTCSKFSNVDCLVRES